MTNDQVPLDNSEEEKEMNKGRLQRNEGGNEDPAAMSMEETKKEENEYYEEGNGGATD
jgi:hypothetical protein